MSDLPVTVVVTTLNEECNIARCLQSLEAFNQVYVVDSHSTDNTVDIAKDYGAEVVLYSWDGQYPKKRGWCLEHLDFQHDWVFWVDADEVVPPAVISEFRRIFSSIPDEDAFFVPSQYVWGGRVLHHGMGNNKIALFHCDKMIFPTVCDLDIDGMGEIEGHYQPVFKDGFEGKIGCLRSPLLHYAYDDLDKWQERHERYAVWEASMTKRNAWPVDPVLWRETVKKILRRNALRPYVFFLYSYFFKFGFLDGRAGYDFAMSRKRYSEMILRALKRQD